MDPKSLRDRIGNTGCPECCGLGYAHFDYGDRPSIQACNTCTAGDSNPTLTDDEAEVLHAAECPCDFLTGGPEVLESDVARRIFGVVIETHRVSVNATMAFDVVASSQEEAKKIAEDVVDRIWEEGVELPNADTEDLLVNAICHPGLDPVEIETEPRPAENPGRDARLKREAAGELYDLAEALERWLAEGDAPLRGDSIIGENDTDTLRAYVRTSLALARGQVTRG